MQKSILTATIALLALSISPALAQRSVEFGYKDRIFEQKYVLPDNVSAAQVATAVLLLAVRLPGGQDPRLIEAMGGQCASTFVKDVGLETLASPERTPTQVALDQLPSDARVEVPRPGMMEAFSTPGMPDEACVLQEMLFRQAYQDSLSTERQLADLARRIRQRFATSLVPAAKVKDPQWRQAADRLAVIAARAQRLQRIDQPRLEARKSLGGEKEQTMYNAIVELMTTAAFQTTSDELDALEAEILADAQARLEQRQSEARQRQQAEEAARQAQKAREQEEELARDAARRAEDAARAEAMRAQESERVRRDQEERARQLAERTGPETASAAPALAPQVQASLPPSPQDMARQRQEVDRLARVRRLEERQAELDRIIARLEDRLADQQGAVLRNPLNLQGALAGVAGMSQARADLDAAQAERREVTQALQSLRKAAATSQAALPPAPEPLVAGDGDCRPGGQCHVIALTLFCRTPQQMAAILSQRPGPARKQVLAALSASDDCRKVGTGQALHWTAPITTIRPQGEAVAELVPGSLADGTQGFMLKDGVIARSGGAPR